MRLLNETELSHFKRGFLELSGHNLDYYQHIHIERRIMEWMQAFHCEQVSELLFHLQQNPKVLHQFLDSLSINVSEFFRNPERFQELRQKILPDLLARRSRLRIWSAGCSVGAEIYSLLILLENLGIAEDCYFLASDVDRGALEKARQGIFYPEMLTQVNKADLSRFFEPCLDENHQQVYVFHKKWREKVHFIHHDLLRDNFPLNFDLIACRNVMIYFTREAKWRVYQHFYQALREGGVLFVGGAEQMFQVHEIGYRRISSYFYQKCKP